MKTPERKKQLIKEKFESVGFSSLDSKKRITLGAVIMKKAPLAQMQIDSFEVFIGTEGDILLKPTAKIPSRELWIYQNPKVIKSIRKGLQEARAGKIKKVKDLNKFLDEL